ncbi:uncharacterized protein BDV14DRAFT_54 [Aspergillus stella-maris]|uniref:uncharacterized protein n=1 Tax=Aspergillus stella-maris TaxID=1810926 RepID=UPI003CCDE5DF
MSIEFFTSSYLKYKADTNAVATWLVATARKCGFPVDTLGAPATGTPPTQAQPSKRLKGKARKAARNTGTAPTPPGNSGAPKHTLAIKDFVGLADYIAAATNPPVRVPAEFVAVLNRAIAVRRQHGNRLEESSALDAEFRESSGRHNYFIGILEHVKQALRPRMPSDQVIDPLTQKADEASTSGGLENLTNSFAGLDVQEPSEAFLNAPNIPMPTPKDDKPTVDYEVERMQDMEEAIFAFNLLFLDLHELRRVIHSTWAGYKRAEFDLVSASIMTNSAIDISQQMEKEIEPLLVKFGGSKKFYELSYMVSCTAQGEDANFKEQPGDEMNFRVYGLSQSLFFPVYSLIDSFCDMVEEGELQIFKPGYFGTFDRASDRSKKSPREKFREDKIIMTEMLSEFLTFDRISPVQPYEDEFTRGLRKAFQTKDIPIWLIFAGQVFLDINHILREDILRPYSDLNVCARWIESSIWQNQEFHSKIQRIDTWPRQNDMAMNGLVQRIGLWVHDDPMRPIKEKYGVWKEADKFKLPKGHPLLCGLVVYHIKTFYQEIAITFAGAWGSIMYSAHLYNALEMEKRVNNLWIDMELVMAWHEEIFVGSRPTDPEGYMKKFNLSTGLSASAFARNRRRTTRLPESKSGPKGIQPLANVSHMFHERYCDGTRKAGFSETDIKNLLDNGKWNNEWEEEEGDEKTISLTRTLRTKSSTLKKNLLSTRRLPPSDLLLVLRNTIQSEAPELSFDYLALHRMCWRLFKALHKECDSIFRSLFGFQYMENETQLPFIVGWIFMVLTGRNAAERMAFAQGGARDKVLGIAEAEIEGMVGTGCGGVAVDIIRRLGYPVEFEYE